MLHIVLIPAYKPDNKMTDLARSLFNQGMTVVIVNDGSGAPYNEIFERAELFAHVVSCTRNGGKGTALKTGLAYIRDHFAPPYTVTTADADGQHAEEDILRVTRKAETRPDTLVIGSRTINREMPVRNWCGNFFTRIAFLLATGKGVQDTQTGLRGFSDRLVPFMLAVRGRRYEYETSVLLHWARCNRPIEEVPVQTLYFDGNSNSHFQPVRDSLRIYGEILKFSAPMLGCFFLDILIFCVLMALLPWDNRLIAANCAARVVAAALCFVLVRRSMAQYPNTKRLSAVRYVVSEVPLMALNTALAWALMMGNLLPFGAKLLANLALFFSFFVLQRKFLFVNKRR